MQSTDRSFLQKFKWNLNHDFISAWQKGFSVLGCFEPGLLNNSNSAYQ